jgi:ethanolamine ammonia-lyase large subunit
MPGEDLFGYIRRVKGRFDLGLYRRLVGAANPFKEGDRIIGVAAEDETARAHARALLGHTRIGALEAHPLFQDELLDALARDLAPFRQAGTAELTLAQLKARLLAEDPEALAPLLAGLGSDAIACVVKLMDDRELTRVGSRFCTPLPGSRIGAPGYLGARVQPNSPTDHPEDILWQVLSAWSYAVGDVVLGSNPAGGGLEAVAAVEAALKDLLDTFGLAETMPHCVLAHIDLQAELEGRRPGSTGIWFQSLAGSTSANATFGLDLDRLLRYADQRSGRFNLYFETGQGADFSNGHAHGTDMVIHEARKYGLVRLLRRRVGRAQALAGRTEAPWVHVNDVAGFIGPEVFRTREQLVRCCLEDLAMGKLHGLTIGLDICSTLHMDLTLDDLEWCQDQVAPACPAYLMALPTRNDPMLDYLTTSFQDHVRLRERFGTRVNDPMWAFYRKLGVIDGAGRPGARFGQPLGVWLQYRRLKGDDRPEAVLTAEGRARMAAVRSRGVPIAEGHGREIWDLDPGLDRDLRMLFADARAVLRLGFTPSFLAGLGRPVQLRSQSRDRDDYLEHPQTGEVLDDGSRRAVRRLARQGPAQVLVLVSDGLNARALMDPGHLAPFLAALDEGLAARGLARARRLLVLRDGRVRAGYRLGEAFFAGAPADTLGAVVHLIGERPGTMHHTFSAYLTVASSATWARGRIDHDSTRLVSGIADTALDPVLAAREVVAILAAGIGNRSSLSD